MTLSLTIGSPPISLVQTGPLASVIGASSYSVTGTLNAPSTAGTTLLAHLPSNGATVLSAPAGWTQLKIASQSGAELDVYAYYNNPGGISSATFTFSLLNNKACLLSEWANVIAVMEASGTATSSSGTTLAPTTSSNVLSTGDLAVTGWYQLIGAATCTFTTPGGFTRLFDNGADAANSAKVDIEYQINPTTEAPLGPTLTSTATTLAAAGAIVVLKAAPLAANQAAYLKYDSLTLQLNTLDFALIDCPTVILAGAAVTLSSPGEYQDWVGTISTATAADIVDRATGHQIQTIAATNTQPPNFTSAPFNLSDNPATNTNDIWLLENGDTFALENGTGSWLLESSIQESSYSGLSIGKQVGSVVPLTYTTIGYVTVYTVGMWAGATFKLTSSNLANWNVTPGNLYTARTITITYHAVPPAPIYVIQFGDKIQTLAEWTAAHA